MKMFGECTKTRHPHNFVQVTLCTCRGEVLVSFLSSCFRQDGTSRPFLKFDIYPLRINFDQSFGHVAFCRLITGYPRFKRVECLPVYGKTVEVGNY